MALPGPAPPRAPSALRPVKGFVARFACWSWVARGRVRVASRAFSPFSWPFHHFPCRISEQKPQLLTSTGARARKVVKRPAWGTASQAGLRAGGKHGQCRLTQALALWFKWSHHQPSPAITIQSGRLTCVLEQRAHQGPESRTAMNAILAVSASASPPVPQESLPSPRRPVPRRLPMIAALTCRYPGIKRSR